MNETLVKTKIETAIYDLIKGEFDHEEAKDILLHMIDKKIEFHNHRNFSSEIRFGHKDEKSVQRLKELRRTRAEVEEFLNLAKEEESTIKITASLNLDLA